MTVHVWGTAPDFVGPRHELRERLLLGLLLSARPGPRVLDVGAGQGTFARRLAARGFEVVPVDDAPAAVAVLRERVSAAAVEADATQLPFPDGSFDAAVLGEVLEHLDSDVAALREVARVLHPGGVVAVSVPRDRGGLGVSDTWAGHRRRYTRAALLAACAQAGLEVERCSAWGFPLSAAYHRHIYERYLDSVGPAAPTGWKRIAARALGVVLQLDRAFVGVERGSLGFLLLARRP
jgi:SAM-dependent methyltransferase